MHRIINKNIRQQGTFKRTRPNDNKAQLNHRISFEKMIVIDEENTRVGVLTKAEALELAEKKELDLLIVSDQGELPIAKILNYEKYRYEQQKKQKINRKKQTVTKVKEVTFQPNIGIHDLEIKAKKAKQWLIDGSSVRVIVRAPGRLVSRNEIINEVYNKFIQFIGINIKIVKPLTRATHISFESYISQE